MPEIGAFEAKTQLSHLFQRVRAGERFIITRHNRPVAELIPFNPHGADKVRKAVVGLQAFQAAHHLEGLPVRDVIKEGRRH